MVALPSLPERASRNAPVAALTTRIFASFTAAPVWSATTMISDDVFGDCA